MYALHTMCASDPSVPVVRRCAPLCVLNLRVRPFVSSISDKIVNDVVGVVIGGSGGGAFELVGEVFVRLDYERGREEGCQRN
ncbi:hypothetical protein Tco_0759644 [Tanacetum coccineum]